MNSQINFNFILKFCAVAIPVLVLSSFIKKDTPENSKTILVIPYQPQMHLSDADAEFADYAKIGVKQVRQMMRNSLNERICFAIRDRFNVRLLTDFGTKQEKNDLEDFYDAEIFSLSQNESTNSVATADTSKSNPYFGIFSDQKKPDYNSSYMNVSLSKPVLFQKTANDYDADYFLILTQLEIKTHYGECVDIANRIFVREFRLHYAVFDAGGNQSTGGYVSANVGSGVKNLNQVSESAFADLVRKLSEKVNGAIH